MLAKQTRMGNYITCAAAFVIFVVPVVIIVYLASQVELMVATKALLFRIVRDTPLEVLVPSVAGLLTVVLSVIIIITSKTWERVRQIELENRRQKYPVYREVLAFWLTVVTSTSADGNSMPKDELREGVSSFGHKLMLLGSDDVVRAYSTFRNILSAKGEDQSKNDEILLALEEVLRAMRRDFGYKSAGMKKGDLMAMIVTDFHRNMKG